MQSKKFTSSRNFMLKNNKYNSSNFKLFFSKVINNSIFKQTILLRDGFYSLKMKLIVK